MSTSPSNPDTQDANAVKPETGAPGIGSLASVPEPSASTSSISTSAPASSLLNTAENTAINPSNPSNTSSTELTSSTTSAPSTAFSAAASGATAVPATTQSSSTPAPTTAVSTSTVPLSDHLTTSALNATASATSGAGNTSYGSPEKETSAHSASETQAAPTAPPLVSESSKSLENIEIDDEDVDMDLGEKDIEMNGISGSEENEGSATQSSAAHQSQGAVNGSAKDKDDTPVAQLPDMSNFTRKDKTLLEFLDELESFPPIIPDAVTDYYLARAGFETADVRIKRLLALATQKFVAGIAADAYQYSRIRSASSVYAANNPQARARALVQGMAGAAAAAQAVQAANAAGAAASGSDDALQQQAAQAQVAAAQAAQAAAAAQAGSTAPQGSANQGKLVLTMEDLGSALSEYGLNVRRPDFYR